MKKTGHCPKCEGTRICRIGRLPDASGDSPGTYPRSVGTVVVRTWLVDSREAQGQLEAYVCTDCGFLEEYVVDPKAVDWEDLEGSSWVRPKGSPPFR